jgi:hypothetical protein
LEKLKIEKTEKRKIQIAFLGLMAGAAQVTKNSKKPVRAWMGKIFEKLKNQNRKTKTPKSVFGLMAGAAQVTKNSKKPVRA